ncbi:MAG TPA: M50 family metallopeptidase [Candidatus Baltobacteraceae bacterium]|jgi:regulator of sigma E protease
MLLGLITLASVGKILIFLLTLSILVVLHEYGHFIVARRNGVRVNEFAVGMGPKVYGWTSPRSGTLYSLRALPIGGYCAMEGEDNKTSEAEQRREFLETGVRTDGNFQSKSTGKRLAIVVAGPIANFILAYLILLVAVLAFGQMTPNAGTTIGPITDGSPAMKAGLQPGDKIVSIDGKAIPTGNAMIETIHGSLGKPLAIVYTRAGSPATATITPAACPAAVGSDKGCIGFSPVSSFERVGFFQAFAAAGGEYVDVVDQEVSSLIAIATHFTQYVGQIRGPIGMGQTAGTIQDLGWGVYFRFAALISIALGVFNLLPLPALDGGRAAFIVAEMLRRKPVDPEHEAFVHIAGFAALMILMLVIAAHDILRIVNGGGALN